jgi:hypothetical protein
MDSQKIGRADTDLSRILKKCQKTIEEN